MTSNSNTTQYSKVLAAPGYSAFAEIDTDILRRNLQILKKQAGSVEIMAVVKADAYGHGVESLSTFLASEGINHFMVATLDEAINLRAYLPEARILVASPPNPDNLGAYQTLNLDVSITSVEVADSVLAVVQDGLSVRIHAKIDTGMNRLGMSTSESSEVIQRLLASPYVEVAGIWTHLATAGDSDTSFAANQIEEAYKIVNQFPDFSGYFHVGNSGALLNLRDKFGFRAKELVRLGGAILGIPASQRLAKRFGLEPIMSLKSVVVHCKTLKAGESVSYGRIWQATVPTKIAIVGAGYADGYPSALSGKANVFIDDVPYPIIGRVCMDMLMIDLGLKNERVKPGDEVLLFGKNLIDIYDLAKQAGLVHYEICCRIPKRVPRKFV